MLAAIRPHVPTLTDKNLEINRKVLYASMELWTDEDIERFGTGHTTREDWEQSIELLHSLGMIERRIDPESCYTNEYLHRN